MTTEKPVEGVCRHEQLILARCLDCEREDAADRIAALETEIARLRAKRTADMPTEQDAINMMFEAWQRLKELGWCEAIYCPKDGSTFDVIEAGSTGIHKCHYDGEWPKGTWWVEAENDLWPSRPILYRKAIAACIEAIRETGNEK